MITTTLIPSEDQKTGKVLILFYRCIFEYFMNIYSIEKRVKFPSNIIFTLHFIIHKLYILYSQTLSFFLLQQPHPQLYRLESVLSTAPTPHTPPPLPPPLVIWLINYQLSIIYYNVLLHSKIKFCWNVWLCLVIFSWFRIMYSQLLLTRWIPANFSRLFSILSISMPAGIYLLKVNYRNTRKRYEIGSKLIIKTPERRQCTLF